MAPLADAHLTVTLAMKDWLAEHFGVRGERVKVLYDKPPLMFRPTSVEEQHELFCRLQLGAHRLNKSSSDREDETEFVERTAFTLCVRKGDAPTVRLRSDRPALLVSSTSWTPDEDFSILLEALEKLHEKIDATYDDGRFPNVMVIMTGKGPQKEYYRPYLEQFNEAHPCINIQTLWLEAGDYPTLLGCATLGISLHTSTSGLDLPMKVLDMFGCQVPVCAIGFDCLGELVEDGVNGRIFENEAELADQLFEFLAGYPGDVATDRLEAYRRNIRGMTRWKENWEECARFHGHTRDVLHVAWCSKTAGQLASCGLDCNIFIWKMGSREPVKKIDTGMPCKGVSWDPMGKYLAAQLQGAEKTVCVWRVRDWKLEAKNADGFDSPKALSTGALTVSELKGTYGLAPDATALKTASACSAASIRRRCLSMRC